MVHGPSCEDATTPGCDCDCGGTRHGSSGNIPVGTARMLKDPRDSVLWDREDALPPQLERNFEGLDIHSVRKDESGYYEVAVSVPIERFSSGEEPRPGFERNVAKYKEAMERGDKFPPVVGFGPRRPGDSVEIINGHTRVEAAKRAGLKTFEAEVVPVNDKGQSLGPGYDLETGYKSRRLSYVEATEKAKVSYIGKGSGGRQYPLAKSGEEDANISGWHPESYAKREMSPGRFMFVASGQTLHTFRTVPGSGFDKSAYDKVHDRMERSLPLDPLFLDVDVGSGKVVSHEGRHRALAAWDLDIQKVPVVVFVMRGRDYVRYDSLSRAERERLDRILAEV